MIKNEAVAFEIDLDDIGFFDFEIYMNREKLDNPEQVDPLM
jgi:hypothetical protein